MSAKSKVPQPTGTVKMRIFKNGKLIEEITQKNLFLTAGKTALSKLLAGVTTNNSVTKFGVGTNSADPAPGDTALTGSFLKAIDAIVYPTTSSVEFQWSLASGEANGTTIREMGILTADDKLIARIKRADIVKDSSLTIEGSWIITF